MLIALSIRDFVLVRSLDLDLGDGFTALTGETGAGKSILLAALGFALGARTDKGAIRKGADAASVTVTFDPPSDHPARQFVLDHDMLLDADEPLVIRRVMRKGGAARGFLNDAPVSARFLQSMGEMLVEVHGQHAGQGLLNVARHRRLLDDYAEVAPLLSDCASAWTEWRNAVAAREAMEGRLARAEADRLFLQHAVEELDKLDPQPGEAESLAAERTALQSSEKVAMAVEDALKVLDKNGPEQALGAASRALSRAASIPAFAEASEDSPLRQKLAEAADAIERALIEAGEAYESVSRLRAESDYSPAALEQSEARLFALRAAARKYDADVDQLAALRDRMRMQLDEIEHSDRSLMAARKLESDSGKVYEKTADRLSDARRRAGDRLAMALCGELEPLKLGKAEFRVVVASLPLDEAGPGGRDRIAFEVRTNPGAAFGPLHKIASGGEVARFALALKVCLVRSGQADTLIFDEADVGVGGAVAAAIGERLLHLSQGRQVLAITHSPQVAAAADGQWRISKGETRGAMETAIDVLAEDDRQEEIARMLAGVHITQEARAAANQLLARV